MQFVCNHLFEKETLEKNIRYSCYIRHHNVLWVFEISVIVIIGYFLTKLIQLVGAVEYVDCISAEG